MHTGNEGPLRFLRAAEQVEAWANELPVWREGTNELWYEFLDREYEAEMALAARLRREPTCKIWMNADRNMVELKLGGLKVHSQHRLRGACLAWAAELRKRVALALAEGRSDIAA